MRIILNIKSVTILLLISLILAMFISSFSSNAHSDNTYKDIYYKLVSIEKSDTLWSIAYISKDEFGISTKNMVELIKEINNMNADTIIAGETIIVPYKK